MHESTSAFILLCFPLTITPGADTALVLKNSLTGQHQSFVMTALGICAGLLFHATESSLGLTAILQNPYFQFGLSTQAQKEKGRDSKN